MTLSKNACLEACLEHFCPKLHKSPAKRQRLQYGHLIRKKCTIWDANVANIHEGLLIFQHSGVSYSTYISDHMYMANPECELLLIYKWIPTLQHLWINPNRAFNNNKYYTLLNGLGCVNATTNCCQCCLLGMVPFLSLSMFKKILQVKHLLGSLPSLIHSRETWCKEASDHVM